MSELHCAGCGNALEEGARFCPSCGTPVATALPGPPSGPPSGPGGPPTQPIGPPTQPIGPPSGPTEQGPAPVPTERGQRSQRAVVWAVSLVVVLGLAGFGLWRMLAGDEDTDPGRPVGAASETPEASPLDSSSSVPTAQASPTAAELAGCSNLTAGYALNYPFEWFTAANTPRQECRFFDEQPFTIAAQPQGTEVAVLIVPLNVAYQDWVDSYEQEGIEIIQRFETIVGGTPATVTEFAFTDDPLEAVNYVYDIDHDGVLAIVASSTYSDDFGFTKLIVDAMAASLEFL